MNKYRVLYIPNQEYFFFEDYESIFEKLKEIFLKRNISNICEEDFDIHENPCEGCINELLNQLSHCDCPNGCLHNKKICNFC